MDIRQKLKSLPIMGWFIRWSYNLLRLNYIKHTLFMQEDKIHAQQEQIHAQQEQIHAQQEQIHAQQEQIHAQQEQIKNYLIKHLEVKVDSLISQKISAQSILFHQRMEAFINELTINREVSRDIPQKETSTFLLDDYYLSFENRFRGSREEIIKRYKFYWEYLPHATHTLLDIGCGRGEWIELLQSKNIDAVGVDTNQAMISEAMAHGIKGVHKADAFDFLRQTSDNSFDAISAFHIIEHIPYTQLFTLLLEIKRVAKPNATILLETPNPANWLVSTYEFYLDPTHRNPLPSELVKFMVEYVGFVNVRVEYLHPFPEGFHLKESSQAAQKLNDLLYQARDYLIIAQKER